ncbi:ribosome biogenesis GTP-binding protein YihA/YsxC [Magnetococcales bacterium HHB-1]
MSRRPVKSRRKGRGQNRSLSQNRLPSTEPPQHHIQFMLGATTPKQFPEDDQPEIAFVGRSNVGKSSLINALLNRKKLARTSRTPGRTREINFFEVDQLWRCVDLPGYGFAKAGEDKHRWRPLIDHYLAERRSIRVVVLLLDIRRGITPLDQMMIDLLRETFQPFLPVATKEDKLKSNAKRKALKTMEEFLSLYNPPAPLLPLVSTSTTTGRGVALLRQRLQALLNP